MEVPVQGGLLRLEGPGLGARLSRREPDYLAYPALQNVPEPSPHPVQVLDAGLVTGGGFCISLESEVCLVVKPIRQGRWLAHRLESLPVVDLGPLLSANALVSEASQAGLKELPGDPEVDGQLLAGICFFDYEASSIYFGNFTRGNKPDRSVLELEVNGLH